MKAAAGKNNINSNIVSLILIHRYPNLSKSLIQAQQLERHVTDPRKNEDGSIGVKLNFGKL